MLENDKALIFVECQITTQRSLKYCESRDDNLTIVFINILRCSYILLL